MKPKQHLYIPNEIFNDLNQTIEKKQHVHFLYSYYYFICHLYRYCEYEGITQSIIKEKLGYNANEKRIDYLIKKNGILDTMGYTITTTNYPISWQMDEDNFIHFKTVDEFKKEYDHIITDKNFKVKYPVKLFFRDEDDHTQKILTGTLYDISNTHNIKYDVFSKCMNSKLLSTTAFYIYGWIKYKNDMYGGAYTSPSRKLSTELGISEPTLFKYVKEMERVKLLKVTHQPFIGEGGEANLYRSM